MVFIYKVSGIQRKRNGINPNCKRLVYYRIVYYKTKTGKDGQKVLRCNILGKVYAKSKIWNINDNFPCNPDDENQDNEYLEKIAIENVNKERLKRNSKAFQKGQAKKNAADAAKKEKAQLTKKYAGKGKSGGQNTEEFWNQFKYNGPKKELPKKIENDPDFRNSDGFEDETPPPKKEPEPKKKIERQTKDENNLPKFYNYQYYLDKDIKSLNKNEAVEEICIDYFVKKMNYIKNNKELFVAYPIWMYYVVTGQYQELIKTINGMRGYLSNINEIIIPYGSEKHNHWLCLKLNLKKQEIKVYDPTKRKEEWMEDIGNLVRHVLNPLGVDIPSENIKFIQNIPNQTGDRNCGVHMMKNIECLVKNKELKYSNKELDQIRNKLKKDMIKEVNNVLLSSDEAKAYQEQNPKDIKKWIANLRKTKKKEAKERERTEEILTKQRNQLRYRKQKQPEENTKEEDIDVLVAQSGLDINSPEVVNYKKPLLLKEELAVFDKNSGRPAQLADEHMNAYIAVMNSKLGERNVAIEPTATFLTMENSLGKTPDEDDREWREKRKKTTENRAEPPNPYQIFEDRIKKLVTTKSKIYMPVCTYNIHWILFEINNEDKTINVYDSCRRTDYNKWVSTVREFLRKVTKINYKHKYHRAVPLQTDGCNCGLFVLKNIECLVFKNGNYDYAQKDMIDIRKRVKKEIIEYMGGVISEKQHKILSRLKQMRQRLERN